MLFAAGHGTRMLPLTNDRPKPLIEVAGQSLIDHALAFTDLPNLRSPVVNLHAFPDQMRAHLKDRNVQFSDETAMLLETGGGLKAALPLLGPGPVVTLNTDAVWHGPNPIPLLLNAWRPQMDALLLTVPRQRQVGHPGPGDFLRDLSGRLRFGPGEIYTGAQMINPAVLAEIAQPDFSMRLPWGILARRGGLFGISYSGHWCDVGQPESIPLAEAMLQEDPGV